ncbi:hypothetical protein BT96DRAFT_1003393 [Gymnopus androsaceus JB14]|uniref:Diels-Alderase N-terminal domain-containing protein n=1 Tax=Gymnopus androsaceus JB14 TaxID=1447944 RepID=A0A6A4GU12_9AGAR|nr:hypothetical protein BT96DRAFT_1003393 [Gymnopus androsaceus JB14]
MKLCRSITLLLGISIASARSTSSVIIPPTTSNDPTQIEFIASSNKLNTPKIFNVHPTMYGQVWTFDAISSKDPSYSILAVFYASPEVASTNNSLDVVVYVQAGPGWLYTVASKFAEFAELNTHGNGTSGVWKGTGCSFSASDDMSTMTIDFTNPFEITGSVVLNAVAPPHYPCSPTEIGASMEFVPHFGWDNAVPDAKTNVDLKVDGTQVKFEDGIGYQDLSWADISFPDALEHYSWAHGRLGPYSIVWFAGEEPDEAAAPNSTIGPIQSFSVEIPFENQVIVAHLIVNNVLLSVNDGTLVHGTGAIRGGVKDGSMDYSGSAGFEYSTSV